MHIITTHHAYLDYCTQTKANTVANSTVVVNPSTCALIHSFAQHHWIYDTFWYPTKTGEKPFHADFVYQAFNDEFNPEYHQMIYNMLKIVGWIILGIGALCYWKKVTIGKSWLLAFCFILNILMSLPSFALRQNRYGIDTTAYIN